MTYGSCYLLCEEEKCLCGLALPGDEAKHWLSDKYHAFTLALMFSWLPIHGHGHVMFYVNNRVVFQHTDTIHVNTSLTASRNVIHILSLASFPGSSPAIVAYIQYGNETSTCAHFIYSMGMRPVYTLYIQCGNETSTCVHFICSIGTGPVYTLRPRFAFWLDLDFLFLILLWSKL